MPWAERTMRTLSEQVRNICAGRIYLYEILTFFVTHRGQSAFRLLHFDFCTLTNEILNGFPQKEHHTTMKVSFKKLLFYIKFTIMETKQIL